MVAAAAGPVEHRVASTGVDGQTARHIEDRVGVERFLDGLREELRSGSFRPLPVKERRIPNAAAARRLRVPCEISSKHAEMSASRTHS